MLEKKWRGAQVASWLVCCAMLPLITTATGWKMQAFALWEIRSFLIYDIRKHSLRTLLELQNQTLRSQEVSKWRCAQLNHHLWLGVECHGIFNYINYIETSYFYTNCSLLSAQSVSALWAIQTPCCQWHSKYSVLFLHLFNIQLYTSSAACYSHPVLRTKQAASSMALLQHYSLQSQHFTVIHVSSHPPVGLLITIYKCTVRLS